MFNFHFCNYSKWSAPYVNLGVSLAQQRVCKTCGKVRERNAGRCTENNVENQKKAYADINAVDK